MAKIRPKYNNTKKIKKIAKKLHNKGITNKDKCRLIAIHLYPKKVK